MKERRAVRLVRTKFQLTFALILAIPVVFSLLVMTVGVLYWLITLEAKNEFWSSLIQEEWITFAIIMLSCFLFLVVIHVFYVLKVSHRLAGPMVAVERYLKTLKNHKGKVALTLRDGDEIMKLAEELEKFKKDNPKFFQ